MPNSEIKTHQARLMGFFDTAPIKHTYGMDLHYEGESAVFTLPYNPNFNQAIGGIHGGVLATLIDNAGWFTAAQFYKNWIATVEFNVRLLEPVKAVDLVAKGKLVRKGKRLATCEMEVCDSSERLVALGSGTFTVTGVSWQDDVK